MGGYTLNPRMSKGFVKCKSDIFLDLPFKVHSNTVLWGSENLEIQNPDSHFESQLDGEWHTRPLALNLSGHLVTFLTLSDFCLLNEISFLANARAYLMDSMSRRPVSLPWYLILGESSFLTGI